MEVKSITSSDRVSSTMYINYIKYINRVNKLCKNIKEKEPEISDVDLVRKIMMKENGNLSSTLIKESNPPTILVRYDGRASELTDEEKQCRSLLIQYKNDAFEMVFSQFEKIKCGEDCIAVLNNSLDKKITTEYCYDGTLMTSIWHEKTNTFIHMTRSCVDAHQSFWHKTSYGEMFESSMAKNNIKFDANTFFEKDCHYFTVLVDYRNKNIIDYTSTFNDPEYSKIVFIAKRRNGTLVDLPVNPEEIVSNGFILSPQLEYKNVDDLMKQLDAYDKVNTDNKRIIHEGIIVKIYDENCYQVLKLQTDKFVMIKKILPNNSNMWTRFLELYRKNQIKEYSEYYEVDKNVLKIINTTFLNMVTELIKIYFKTRNNNNPELYNVLPKSYRTALYEIHGMYINKKMNYNDENKDNDDMIVKADAEKIGITTSDINSHLRVCDIDFVLSLIIDRIYLINTFPKQYYQQKIINVGCQDAYVMAKNINNDEEFIKIVNKYYRRTDP